MVDIVYVVIALILIVVMLLTIILLIQWVSKSEGDIPSVEETYFKQPMTRNRYNPYE